MKAKPTCSGRVCDPTASHRPAEKSQDILSCAGGLVVILITVALVGLTGCEIEVPGGEFITPTSVIRGSTPTPVIIGKPTINPTETPRPMPPTPTTRPSPTPPLPTPTMEEATPTPEEATPTTEAQETATATQPGATETPTLPPDTATPVPTDTPPPRLALLR